MAGKLFPVCGQNFPAAEFADSQIEKQIKFQAIHFIQLALPGCSYCSRVRSDWYKLCSVKLPCSHSPDRLFDPEQIRVQSLTSFVPSGNMGTTAGDSLSSLFSSTETGPALTSAGIASSAQAPLDFLSLLLNELPKTNSTSRSVLDGPNGTPGVNGDQDGANGDGIAIPQSMITATVLSNPAPVPKKSQTTEMPSLPTGDISESRMQLQPPGHGQPGVNQSAWPSVWSIEQLQNVSKQPAGLFARMAMRQTSLFNAENTVNTTDNVPHTGRALPLESADDLDVSSTTSPAQPEKSSPSSDDTVTLWGLAAGVAVSIPVASLLLQAPPQSLAAGFESPHAEALPASTAAVQLPAATTDQSAVTTSVMTRDRTPGVKTPVVKLPETNIPVVAPGAGAESRSAKTENSNRPEKHHSWLSPVATGDSIPSAMAVAPVLPNDSVESDRTQNVHVETGHIISAPAASSQPVPVPIPGYPIPEQQLFQSQIEPGHAPVERFETNSAGNSFASPAAVEIDGTTAHPRMNNGLSMDSKAVGFTADSGPAPMLDPSAPGESFVDLPLNSQPENAAVHFGQTDGHIQSEPRFATSASSGSSWPSSTPAPATPATGVINTEEMNVDVSSDELQNMVAVVPEAERLPASSHVIMTVAPDMTGSTSHSPASVTPVESRVADEGRSESMIDALRFALPTVQTLHLRATPTRTTNHETGEISAAVTPHRESAHAESWATEPAPLVVDHGSFSPASGIAAAVNPLPSVLPTNETFTAHPSENQSPAPVRSRTGTRPIESASATPLTGASDASAPPLLDTGADSVTPLDHRTIDQIIASTVIEARLVDDASSQRFHMRLDPPELGGISIDIHRSSSGEVSVHIAAVSAQTHHLLEQRSTEIVQALHDQGLSLSQFDLSHHQQQDSSREQLQYREQFENSRLVREARDQLQVTEPTPPTPATIAPGRFSFRA